MCYCVFYFFFFKQKTAYEMRISDWSSDVCSSDLLNVVKTLSCGPRLAFISSDFPLSLRLLISRSLVRIQQGSPLLPQRLCSTPDARTFSVLLGLFSKRELSRMPD